MNLSADGCSDGKIWRCRRTVAGVRHENKTSIRKGSIFGNSHISIRKVLYLLYEWAANTSVASTAYELSLDEETVMEWFKRFREIAGAFTENRINRQIGSTNDIIEIDECQIGRRKFHRGRRPREVWLFGAVVRGSVPLRLVIESVRKRNRATLIPIIRDRVAAGATIVSDGWAAYEGLQEMGFTHLVVNHSTSFVSPENPEAHTQNVENLWRCLRRFLNSKTAYSRRHLMSYVQEFVFRKSFIDIFETMISAIEEATTD